jgi:phospho-N-acetylmuramoyl-pentapeptide-transferase
MSIVLWGRFSLSHPYLLIAIFMTVWMGGIGFLDDYLKFQQKKRGEQNRGLVEKYKLAGQVTAGLALGLYLVYHPMSPNLPGASTTLPFFKYYLVTPLAGFAWLYVLFTTFIMTGTSNAVNITDGLDGLLAGSAALVFAAFVVISFTQFRHPGKYDLLAAGSIDVAVVAAAMLGACVGFLWWQGPPAKVFMGDTGALAIGGAMAGLGLLTNTTLLLPIIGGLYVVEALSVIAQVISFRGFGRRVLRMSPIHHHFELLGWPESTIIVRFWIFAGLSMALGLGLFYADFLRIPGVNG